VDRCRAQQAYAGVGPQERDWSNHPGAARRSADVFITNQSPASRSRLGISYEQLSEINPRLVYAALTGYGETGPGAESPGCDAHAYWARSGLADNVRPDGESPPASPTMGMGDQPTAVTLYAGLSRRFFTGSARAWEAASRRRCLPTERGRMRHRSRRFCAVARSSTVCRGRRPGTL
jgi:Predicted acyl-CoA transferases/carnitine dehydratase